MAYILVQSTPFSGCFIWNVVEEVYTALHCWHIKLVFLFMVLILDGKSKHVAQALNTRKNQRNNPICDYTQSNQLS